MSFPRTPPTRNGDIFGRYLQDRRPKHEQGTPTTSAENRGIT